MNGFAWFIIGFMISATVLLLALKFTAVGKAFMGGEPPSRVGFRMAVSTDTNVNNFVSLINTVIDATAQTLCADAKFMSSIIASAPKTCNEIFASSDPAVQQMGNAVVTAKYETFKKYVKETLCNADGSVNATAYAAFVKNFKSAICPS